MKIKKISFLIPCYNSYNTVSSVIDEIISTMDKAHIPFEIIPVNDCSTDDVWNKLKDIAKKNKNVKPISLAKNAGRTNALLAGMPYATGDVIVITDDDGQCPIDRVFDLIKPIQEEDYLVCFAKYPEKKQSKFKNFGSSVNSIMASQLIGKPADLQVSNFAALNKLICKEIIKYTGPYPYFSGLILRCTNKICNVEMEERDRTYGTTTYTFKKLIGTWMNGFTAFSIKPLRVSSFIGVVSAIAGFIYGLFIVIRKLVLKKAILSGYSSIAALILFMGGIIMLLLGLIGEYLGRIYITINQAPQYTIEEKINIK